MTLTDIISNTLQSQFDLNLNQDVKVIADCILKMSDFYIRYPNHPTPWNESWCQIAQLSYYLPLNYIRTQAAFERWGVQLDQITQLFDFGCGLSPMSWYFYLNPNKNKLLKIYLFDQSQIPIQLLKKMGLPITQVLTALKFKTIAHAQNTLTSCSYVLTEIYNQKDWQWLLGCENLFILEPSTQVDSRRLMEFRALLLKNGFNIQAPCTHHSACPLLIHSKSDWCHDRVTVSFEFLKNLEKHLPFYNHTVTFSYLISTKQPKVTEDERPHLSPLSARVIGDTLKEKGKTKQAICFNEDRTFLAWLDKDWPNGIMQIPRGSKFQIPSYAIQKGTPQNREIRLKPLDSSFTQ